MHASPTSLLSAQFSSPTSTKSFLRDRNNRTNTIPRKSVRASRAPAGITRCVIDDDAVKKIPSSSSFRCEKCNDSGYQTCASCDGHGSLAAGGFSSKNSINFNKVVGTNWTALRRTRGWRHFEATQTRVESKTKSKFVTLSATCDREQKIEVPLTELKNRELWAAGWQQKENIEWNDEERDNSGALIGKPKRSRKACKRCEGEGKILCKCKAAKAMQRQKLVQISVETRLKELSKSDGVDLETKKKAKKAVKEMAREKEKEERRKRELKIRFNQNEDEDGDEDETGGPSGAKNDKENVTDADGSWADAKLRKRDELLEKWIQGGASIDDDKRQ
jgi:tryptophan-rich hypothetical protein